MRFCRGSQRDVHVACVVRADDLASALAGTRSRRRPDSPLLLSGKPRASGQQIRLAYAVSFSYDTKQSASSRCAEQCKCKSLQINKAHTQPEKKKYTIRRVRVVAAPLRLVAHGGAFIRPVGELDGEHGDVTELRSNLVARTHARRRRGFLLKPGFHSTTASRPWSTIRINGGRLKNTRVRRV
jgi:hypothetical protein